MKKMKKMASIKIILTLSIIVSVVSIASGSYAQPKIPKDKIPSDIPAKVRKEIEGLYHSDGKKRANAATRLGELGTDAVPAIPFLIEMLCDSKILMGEFLQTVKIGDKVMNLHAVIIPGEEAKKALVKIGNPSVELLITALKDENSDVQKRAVEALKEITKQSLGKDPDAWLEWWKEHKE